MKLEPGLAKLYFCKIFVPKSIFLKLNKLQLIYVVRNSAKFVYADFHNFLVDLAFSFFLPTLTLINKNLSKPSIFKSPCQP